MTPVSNLKAPAESEIAFLRLFEIVAKIAGEDHISAALHAIVEESMFKVRVGVFKAFTTVKEPSTGANIEVN